jgi:long-chain acyl-CoA synthetase
LFSERVRRTPHAYAYRRFNAKEQRFEAITWEEVSILAARWQVALGREGLLPGDRVAVGLKNCLEWVLFDLAALGLGLVTVPLFANDQPENSASILRETGSRLALIEDEEQWVRIQEIGDCLPGIERIVTLGRLRHPDSQSDATKPTDQEAARTHTGLGDSGEPNADKYSRTNLKRDSRLSELAGWLPEQSGDTL